MAKRNGNAVIVMKDKNNEIYVFKWTDSEQWKAACELISSDSRWIDARAAVLQDDLPPRETS